MSTLLVTVIFSGRGQYIRGTCCWPFSIGFFASSRPATRILGILLLPGVVDQVTVTYVKVSVYVYIYIFIHTKCIFVDTVFSLETTWNYSPNPHHINSIIGTQPPILWVLRLERFIIAMFVSVVLGKLRSTRLEPTLVVWWSFSCKYSDISSHSTKAQGLLQKEIVVCQTPAWPPTKLAISMQSLPAPVHPLLQFNAMYSFLCHSLFCLKRGKTN